MQMEWTIKAESDLHRLYDFLLKVNPLIAKNVVQKLVASAGTLMDHPRIGTRLPDFTPHEIRRLIIGDYEIRYLINDDIITVLRLWHTREDR